MTRRLKVLTANQGTFIKVVALVAMIGVLQGANCLVPPTTTTPISATISGTTSFTTDSSTTLTANVSDATGTVTYAWTVDSGSATLSATDTQSVTVSSTTAGSSTISVTATDSGTGTSASASATVTASAPTTTPPPTTALSVTASASSTTPSVGDTVSLLATITGGTAPFTFSWTQTAGGAGATIANATTQTPSVTFSAADTYTFSVAVQDADGTTATATVDVTASGSSSSLTFTIGIDTLTGTSGDDAFSAPSAVTTTGAQANTLSTGDSADGGAGTDTLTTTWVGGTAINIAPTLSNIETVNITDFNTGGASTLTGTNISGVTAFNVASSTQDLTITNLDTIATLGLSDTTTDVTIGFATAATSGSSDAATVNLSNVTDGTAANRSVITLTTGAANGFESATINSTGSANKIMQITQGTGNTLATLNVTGDQDLQIDTALDTSVTTIDANAFTGGLEVSVTGTAAAVAFTGGSGDDTVFYGANYGTTDVIDGGAGTDFLGLVSAEANVGTTDQTNVTNTEGLRFTDELAATLTTDYWNDAAIVTLDDGMNAGTIVFPTAVDAFTVNVGLEGANNTAGGAATITAGGSGTSDVLTININDFDFAALTLNGCETVNIVSNVDLDGTAAAGGSNIITTFLLQNTLTSRTVTVTGTEDLNITGVFTGKVLDASAFTEALLMTQDQVSGEAVTITGGSGNDVLSGSDSADVISGGAGDDTLIGEDAADVLTGGDGSDTFNQGHAVGTTADTITDFAVGSDVVAFDLSEIDAVVTETTDGGATDVLAADAIDLATYNNGSALSLTATDNVIIVSNTTGINTTADINTAGGAISYTANTDDSDGIVLIYYDADDGQAVITVVVDTDSDADATINGSNVTFNEMTRMTMSTTDYAALATTNFDFIN